MAVNGTALDRVFRQALEHEGYIKQDGTPDWPKMRARILETVITAKVLKKTERSEKAIKRPDLVAVVFPHVLNDWEQTEDETEAALKEALYKRVQGTVWDETRPNADMPVQRLIGVNMGNGYVLCRTKVGVDKTPAVYVTDNKECIQLDFTRPDNAALDRRIKGSTNNREMLVLRQPHNAGAYASEYDATLKAALSTAKNQMQLAVQSVTANQSEDEADEEADE